MQLKYFKIIRPVSVIVLAFFLWTFGGIFDIAYAFNSATEQKSSSAEVKNSPQSIAHSQKQKEQRPEEQFEKTLEKIRDAEERADKKIQKGENTEPEEKEIKNQKAEIEKHDIEIRKQFKETENKIKDLPEVIRKRHHDFVKKYEENLATLKTNLDEIEKANTKEEKKLAHKKTKEFLEKTKPPKKHKPLDPNKLPHRTAEPVFKEPRTKPEQFEKDSVQLSVVSFQGKTKNQKLETNNQPILVAANGPLDGLLDENSKYSVSAVIPAQAGIQTGYPIEAFGYDKLNKGTSNFPTSGLPDLQASALYALADPPTDADLSQTVEVQFTPQIMAKAQELGNNPVKIYEYVKNNFFFEPYYGSLKGAHETLLEKAGNDFDQASLLISLLRASNIPARYAYGTVEIPIEKIKKWLGVESETIAGEILSANGIPVSLINEGGKISKARLEHVWIEAWVSYDNYRGHPNSQNKTWIPLDASFKQVQYTRGPDLKEIMNFDPNAFMDELMAHSTYSTSDYNVSHVDETFMQQKLQEYQTRLNDYITSNIPNAKPQDLMGKFDILYEKFGILPATLPYKVIAKGTSYSEIPDTLRHKLKVNIKNIDYLDFFGTGDINYQGSLTQLAGKKITISYIPATAADENTLKNYGSLSATPAYLVNMKPVLMIDGVSVATGGEIGLGTSQQISLTFLSPNISTDIITHNLTSGGYHAIGIDLQRIPKALLQKQTERMRAMKAYLESILSGTPSTPPSGDAGDNLFGDMLYDVAINYFYNLDSLNDLMSRVADIIWVRQPSEAMVFVDLKVSSIFGIPFTAKPVGMSIDVSRNILSPFHMTGDKNVEKAFKLQSAAYMSSMEHIIFEWMFNVNAVSTVKVLQEANTLSIPIYAVTTQNIEQILPLLQVSSDVKSDIQNAVNAGLTVIVPKREITLNNWSGIGYIVQNPATFASTYKISGGINGGSTACLTDGNCYFNAEHPCILPGGETNLWSLLLDDIDRLLAFVPILFTYFKLSYQLDFRAFADELCTLLQGADPNASEDAIKADQILRQFRSDVVLMVWAIAFTKNPLPTAISDQIFTVFLDILIESYGFHSKEVYYYAGYFVVHYLYEYIVLFSAGMMSAFPDLEY